MSKEISQAVIRRLPRYYRYLGELLDEGVERISSNDLSHRMKVTASQIRQDLNNFGGFGQQGYGYNVQFLYEEIGKIMGLNTEHRIIIIGAGNLGQALANYVKFEKLGFELYATSGTASMSWMSIAEHTGWILRRSPCQSQRLTLLRQSLWI